MYTTYLDVVFSVVVFTTYANVPCLEPRMYRKCITLDKKKVLRVLFSNFVNSDVDVRQALTKVKDRYWKRE